MTFFGGPTILYKMLPVKCLDAAFMFEQFMIIWNCIKEVGGNLFGIICDSNRTNMSFFSKFICQVGKSWLTVDGLYLLFDFVNLLKSVRNNWITEKQQQIDFMDKHQHYTAKWSDIVDLFNVEKKDMFRPSRLKEVSVFPKPIERQREATCLNIFSDDTIADLKSKETVHNNEGTGHFLEMIVRFLKIVNCKNPYGDKRFNDPDMAPIEDASDQRLIFLLNLAHIADNMAEQTGKRYKCLTKDTAKALAATCRGFVDIAKQLLTTTHEYVLFGLFTTDPLEKMFGKLRQGVGGTYFINVRQVLENLAIHQTTIMLKSDQIFFEMEAKLGHQRSLQLQHER